MLAHAGTLTFKQSWVFVYGFSVFILFLDLFCVGRAHSAVRHLWKPENNLQGVILTNVDLGESHPGHQAPLPTEPSHQLPLSTFNLLSFILFYITNFIPFLWKAQNSIEKIEAIRMWTFQSLYHCVPRFLLLWSCPNAVPEWLTIIATNM